MPRRPRETGVDVVYDAVADVLPAVKDHVVRTERSGDLRLVFLHTAEHWSIIAYLLTAGWQLTDVGLFALKGARR